ncbi:MAG TPA: Ig-like domain-containing protein [Candidatus Dormibacteraeota bacterium]|nr:Ig-like domain-containing protein [Candidatus Dormibacteraeota bacterium]
MSQRHDPDLESIFDKEPGLERYASLLGASRLKPPPLDPGFRHALRRELVTKAYDRYQRGSRPGFFANLFTGPRMAAATVLVGAVLVAFLLLANANLTGSGSVTITTVGNQVQVDQPILVSFSQPMDHQSVEQAIQIQPATQVTYSWQGNNLAIQPVSGQLAPNTQYHVTVTADAKTAPGTPIGKPATVSVTTQPLPSPSPTPVPSPTPTREPKIVAEQQLSGTSGSVVGFSADGHSLFFLTPGGDLDEIGVDGTGLRTIHSGVGSASVAPSDAALAFTVVGQGGGVYLGGPAGENAQLLDSRAAQVIGWLAGKPFVVAGTDLGPAGAAPIAKLPLPADGSAKAEEVVLSPDGKSLVWTTELQPNAEAQSSPATYLMDLASQKVTPWPTAAAYDLAWSPDSSKVAFWSSGSVKVANPDGGSPLTIAPAPSALQPRWTDDGHRLLIGGPDGASIVGSDGSDLQKLSQAAFGSPAWAPGDASLSFIRDGAVWVDQLSTADGASLDLGAAAAVVDAYEKAKIAGDGATAAGLLGPSASPVAPSPLPTDQHLERYFVISSQATATNALFTARLIFARGQDEVRYQDELVVVINTAAGLRIDSVSDGPPQALGVGPTVNSVTLSHNQLVIVFDSDLDPATVAGSVSIAGDDGKQVPVTTRYDHRNLTVDAVLNPGASYRLAISGALKDIAGQPIEGGYTYSFVAPAAPPGG